MVFVFHCSNQDRSEAQFLQARSDFVGFPLVETCSWQESCRQGSADDAIWGVDIALDVDLVDAGDSGLIADPCRGIDGDDEIRHP